VLAKQRFPDHCGRQSGLEFHIAERSLLRRKPDERLRFLHYLHNENESSHLESVHASPTHRLSLVHWGNPTPGGS
jgi:hypothetical protein